MKSLSVLPFVLCVLMYSCTSSQTISKMNADEVLHEIHGTIVFNPRTGNYDTVYLRNSRIDTVDWKNPPMKITASPIGANNIATVKSPVSNRGEKLEKVSGAVIVEQTKSVAGLLSASAVRNQKKVFRVAYLLPFFTDKFSESENDIYEKSKWALHFYSGAKLALDSLENDNIRLEISVKDTKASEMQFKQLLLQESVMNADVIIGGETNTNVELAADFAKKNGKILISPYNPSSEMVTENPQFVQINPGLRTNCEAIMRNIRKTFTPGQIILLCRDKPNEKEALQYLQLEHLKLSAKVQVPLKEYIIEDKNGVAAFDPKIFLNKDNVVIVMPVWGQNSETFVYSLLSKINSSRGKKNVIVYGMPQWSNFQVNVFDVFEPLQVHITQPVFIDRFSPDAVSFSASFFEKYHAAPTDEAFIGYDITLYCGLMLKKYGARFNEVMDKMPYDGLHTHFLFEKDVNPGHKPSGPGVHFDRIVNKYVNILKFHDGCFGPVN